MLPVPKSWNRHKIRVVDPDPDWIRIQGLCGSGLGIRIPDLGARKLRNFSATMHFLVFKKNFLPLNRYKIALTTFWKKL
jgi:hypothetical protein